MCFYRSMVYTIEKILNRPIGYDIRLMVKLEDEEYYPVQLVYMSHTEIIEKLKDTRWSFVRCTPENVLVFHAYEFNYELLEVLPNNEPLSSPFLVYLK